MLTEERATHSGSELTCFKYYLTVQQALFYSLDIYFVTSYLVANVRTVVFYGKEW